MHLSRETSIFFFTSIVVLLGTSGLFVAGLDLILDRGSSEDLVSYVFVSVEKMWEVIGFSKEMRPEENSDRNIQELNYPDLNYLQS